MTDWSFGYVTEIGYTHGYYRELDPKLLSLAALIRGTLAPGLDGRPVRILELGCGQGLSANILAAANSGLTYTAADFNPAQVAGARELAEAAGTPNIQFSEASFAEIAEDPSLGPFDVITLHGIYTWVSAENRAHIQRIAREKLRPGGLLYLSYNTYPGWASFVPLRRVFRDVAADNPALPIGQRLDAGFALLTKLADAQVRYIHQVPGMLDRIKRTGGMPHSYLAHEYLNDEWTVFHFADVVADMGRAKLSFVGSTHLLDCIDPINLTPDQQALLAAVPDPIRRQSLRDLCVNQQFRRDLFVKGAVPLSVPQGQANWLDLRVALVTRAAEVPRKITASLGEVELQADTYEPLLAALDAGPRTVRDLLADPTIAALGWPRTQQALVILIGMGAAQPCAPLAGEDERAARCDALNAVILERARHSAELNYLASPVLGGAVQVDRFGQLALLAARQGQRENPVMFIWNTLKAQGHQVMKDGKTLQTDAENIAEINRRVSLFHETMGPVLERLKVR